QLVEESRVDPVRLVVGGAREPLQQVALLLVQLPRHSNVDEDAVVAAAEPLEHRHPATAEDADFAGLRPRLELELDVSVERRHRDDPALTSAVTARVRDLVAGTAAGGTPLSTYELAERTPRDVLDPTGAAACRAGDGARPRCRAVAAARRTADGDGKRDV